jgi:hypothetical protein
VEGGKLITANVELKKIAYGGDKTLNTPLELYFTSLKKISKGPGMTKQSRRDLGQGIWN